MFLDCGVVKRDTFMLIYYVADVSLVCEFVHMISRLVISKLYLYILQLVKYKGYAIKISEISR